LTILQRKSGQNRKREGCKWAVNNIGHVELIPAIDFTVCAVVVELPFSDYNETTQTHFSATLASTRKYTLLWWPSAKFRIFCLARATKNNEKKGRPLKFFIHRSKLQTGTSNENQHTDSSMCPRLLPLHTRLFSQRRLTRICGCGPGTRYRADYLRFCVVIIIASASL
jgi:hypothetical protein